MALYTEPDFPDFEVIVLGSERDIELREQLKATSKPSPKLPNNIEELVFNCPVCGVDCKSQNYSETLVGCISPEGHNHDDNCRKFRFSCSNGHKFLVRAQNTCPTEGCKWEGKPLCFTCGNNVKVVS
jgi:hypothetical protein